MPPSPVRFLREIVLIRCCCCCCSVFCWWLRGTTKKKKKSEHCFFFFFCPLCSAVSVARYGGNVALEQEVSSTSNCSVLDLKTMTYCNFKMSESSGCKSSAGNCSKRSDACSANTAPASKVKNDATCRILLPDCEAGGGVAASAVLQILVVFPAFSFCCSSMHPSSE